MNLNLLVAGCQGFHIATECHIPNEIYDKIIKKVDSSYDYAKKGIKLNYKYEINGAKYCVFGLIISSGKNGNFSFSLFYHQERSKKKKIHDEISAIDIIDILSEINIESNFSCSANFEFNPNTFTPIIPLPIKFNDFLFDEIRGFRLAKTIKKGLKFDVIIERPFNKKIYQTLSYESKNRFSKELPSSLFEIAKNISTRFIIQKFGG